MFERRGTVANQGGALDGSANPAIPDAIGLGAGKNEFPVGDIHLSAAKTNGVDAILQIRDDILRRAVPTQHVGICHTRHRGMGVAFAPPVAGGRHPHQPCILAILHITHQHTIFDQHVFARWSALVIDRNGPTAVRNRPVIQHGDAFTGDPFSHQPRKSGRALAVEIAL